MMLWIWLHVMDLIAAMPGGFGSRPYLWAVEHASDRDGLGAGGVICRCVTLGVEEVSIESSKPLPHRRVVGKASGDRLRLVL